ncbi:sensor histidine kinase [Pararobbsia silviterrae]|uniref:histidine kinase n=2 Tax=Pararobbsia silviterrae TaxID=1792498 RepID=A0A494Y5D4_9BURK|nr:sensor histidine kinase [Pararobbsia silviterrae]
MLQTRLNKARLIEAQMEAVRASSVLEAERASKDAQSRFLAMLTHELRAPLSALRLCLAGLPKAGNLRRYAEAAVVQIDTVIERCDLASRFDDGKLAVAKTWCALHELVSDVLVQRPHGERIAFDHDYDPSIVMQSDPALLKTILDNLTGNALKYSPPDTPILLTAHRQIRDAQQGVCIRVENQIAGPAMRPNPERVFSKYYRAPLAQRSTGSGLGLYIARGMSALLGGDIRYISDQPNVIFEVWIPA